MTLSPVSVVVVSHGRPSALVRCLAGLSQLTYPDFEIVVVADARGLSAIESWHHRIKTVRFDEENISAARNKGIASAAGEIVAFIDDDAVPEPTWLNHLASAFSSPAVAAGGYVIGRNGISLQWGARIALSDATTEPLPIRGQEPEFHRAEPGLAIKTEGTNMAFRRDKLAQMGGFDPVFRFYLDETDINLRLAKENSVAAVVPRALVHHGFEASVRRSSRRVPLTLFEIGASVAVFVRRHAVGADHDELVHAERQRQSGRLFRLMVDGWLEPRDVRRLLNSFDRGADAGLARPLLPLQPIALSPGPFMRFETTTPKGHKVLAGRIWARSRIAREAKALVRDGYRVSVFLLSPTTRRHRVEFHRDGYWLQTGGLFGAAERSESAFRYVRFHDRIEIELERLAGIRDL